MNDSFLFYRNKLKEKTWKYIKFFLVIVFIEAFLIFVLYILTYSPFLEIKEIKITNLGELDENEVLDFIKIYIFGNSFIKKILTFKNILIWPNYLENNSNLFLPIKSLYLKKNYLNRRIEISINKRQEIGMWCLVTKNECFWFDDSGLFFKKSLFSDGGAILKVYDYTSENIGLGFKIDSLKVKIITQIFDFLKKNNIEASKIKLSDLNLEEIEVITEGGLKIYFSLKFSPPDISMLISDFKKQGVFDKLKYLDLRIKNKLYYQ